MRKIKFEFTIPFDGGAADICEQEIRRSITYHLLNSLSEIHPDIRVRIESHHYIEEPELVPAREAGARETR